LAFSLPERTDLYPVVQDQAYYAVLRYDPRRRDKIQELVCQSYEKFRNDTASGKEIKKQNYKYFVTQRAKEVDKDQIKSVSEFENIISKTNLGSTITFLIQRGRETFFLTIDICG
jgi:hypothetical protein